MAGIRSVAKHALDLLLMIAKSGSIMRGYGLGCRRSRPWPVQVSELSHRLGTAEGSNRSLEEENTRLKSLNQSVSQAKHELDIQLNEAKAKVLSLEEKVGWARICARTQAGPGRPSPPTTSFDGLSVPESGIACVRGGRMCLVLPWRCQWAWGVRADGVAVWADGHRGPWAQRARAKGVVGFMLRCAAARPLDPPQSQSQAEVVEQQKGRLRDLEAAMRQLDSRCTDLRDVAVAADARGKEAQAEVLKGNQIIEKLTVSGKGWKLEWGGHGCTGGQRQACD